MKTDTQLFTNPPPFHLIQRALERPRERLRGRRCERADRAAVVCRDLRERRAVPAEPGDCAGGDAADAGRRRRAGARRGPGAAHRVGDAPRARRGRQEVKKHRKKMMMIIRSEIRKKKQKKKLVLVGC
jgi:hypothetical protein